MWMSFVGGHGYVEDLLVSLLACLLACLFDLPAGPALVSSIIHYFFRQSSADQTHDFTYPRLLELSVSVL